MRLLVSLFVFISVSALAGGVDVGNGGLSRTVNVLVDKQFKTEVELQDYLSLHKEDLRNGALFNMNVLRSQYDCKGRIDIVDMEQISFYPYRNGSIGTKEYQGKLKLKLKNCN